eukprot:TRINITY_DN3385_c0_g1_i4.p1 TRINITY_DN3385_c0_g1~~TRINITY_DN3385_c0_g1_i4.p1  ORF type:complete len:178 (+),score=31.02 TRINITY_DN3385_c0_g1_i4:684-1217(+)
MSSSYQLTLHRLGLNVAEVIEQGDNYCVKTWVEGIRGDKWYKRWSKQDYSPNYQGVIELVEMYSLIASKEHYVQNLKGENLIWTGEKWVVIDSGYIRNLSQNLSMLKACLRFDAKWPPREMRPTNQFVLHEYLIEHGFYVFENVKISIAKLTESRVEKKLERALRKQKRLEEEAELS